MKARFASGLPNTIVDPDDLATSLLLLDRSMEDIRHGRTRCAKSSLIEIATELNLKLDRPRGARPNQQDS